MPTENRSSNTEMVSVPREVIEFAAGLKWHGHKSGTDQKDDQLHALKRLRAILAAPAPQPHAEPIAWMVGTAFWWTKEEAERDAAETGLPIVGLGPMKDMGEVKRLRAELIGRNARVEGLRAQLAERDALLREKSGDLIRMAVHLISAPLVALQDLQDEDKKMTRARVDKAVETADARLKDAAYELRRIADAISASAGPSSPTWSCQACQVEQPTDRACDACGGDRKSVV